VAWLLALGGGACTPPYRIPPPGPSPIAQRRTIAGPISATSWHTITVAEPEGRPGQRLQASYRLSHWAAKGNAERRSFLEVVLDYAGPLRRVHAVDTGCGLSPPPVVHERIRLSGPEAGEGLFRETLAFPWRPIRTGLRRSRAGQVALVADHGPPIRLPIPPTWQKAAAPAGATPTRASGFLGGGCEFPNPDPWLHPFEAVRRSRHRYCLPTRVGDMPCRSGHRPRLAGAGAVAISDRPYRIREPYRHPFAASQRLQKEGAV